LQVGGLPFAVSDPVKAREGGLRVLAQIPEALAEFTKFGHVLVAMTATADYHVVTHDPIRNLADLKGKKVGTFGRIAPKVLQAGGAIPVSTTGGEMYEALQRKTIDARINSYEGTKRFKLYEVAKYISTISMGAIAGVNMFTINKRKWDSLSKEHQKILLEEGERVGKWEAQAMRDGDAEFQKYLQGKGMQIVEFSAEDREKWNWANSLVHAKEALEAVQLGTADMADLALGYFTDKIRLMQVGGLPFSVSDPVRARNGGLRVLSQVPEALAELHKFGHKVVAMTSTATYHIVGHQPIRTLADLKGKKVGTFGRIAPKVIQAGGGVSVSTTGGEMYEALQRKTIDQRIISYEAHVRFKTYEVAKYVSTIDIGAIAGVNTFTINKRKWDSLSKEHQKILLEEGEKVGVWEAQAMKDDEGKFKKYLQDKGVEIVEFSAKDREKWKNSPGVKKIAADWVAGMEKLGLPGRKVLALYRGE
jgi:TRAP-type C4-dicarboxylate transport system substrate-binding protein